MVRCSPHIGNWIFPQLQFAEFHRQGIKQQQASGKTIATAENELDRLHGL